MPSNGNMPFPPLTPVGLPSESTGQLWIVSFEISVDVNHRDFTAKEHVENNFLD